MTVKTVEPFSFLGCVPKTRGTQKPKAEIPTSRWGDREPRIIFQLPYICCQMLTTLPRWYLYSFTWSHFTLQAGHSTHSSYLQTLSISLVTSRCLCMSCQYLFWIAALNRNWIAYWYAHRHRQTLIFTQIQAHSQKLTTHSYTLAHTVILTYTESTHTQIKEEEGERGQGYLFNRDKGLILDRENTDM